MLNHYQDERMKILWKYINIYDNCDFKWYIWESFSNKHMRRAEPSRAEPSRTKQNQTELNRRKTSFFQFVQCNQCLQFVERCHSRRVPKYTENAVSTIRIVFSAKENTIQLECCIKTSKSNKSTVNCASLDSSSRYIFTNGLFCVLARVSILCSWYWLVRLCLFIVSFASANIFHLRL